MNNAARTPSAPVIPLPVGTLDVEREFEWENEEGAGNQGKGSLDILGEMPRQGFLKLLKTVVVNNYKAFPKRILKDAIWVLPLAAVWMFLWTIKGMTMYKLPGPIRILAWVGIFLTATYNGFLGKAAFVTVISRTFIPLVKGIAKGEGKTIGERYKKTWKLIFKLIQTGKTTSAKIMLLSGGLGLIASNLLTRNNKIDKYFICLLCATALFDDLSKGQGNIVVKLTSTALRDIPMLVGKAIEVNMRTTYLTLSGFAAGLVLAIVPGQFVNSYVSPMGAIFGAVLIVAGVALRFVGEKSEKGS